MGRSIGICSICFKFSSDVGVAMRSFSLRHSARINALLGDYHAFLCLQLLSIVNHMESELGTLAVSKV